MSGTALKCFCEILDLCKYPVALDSLCLLLTLSNFIAELSLVVTDSQFIAAIELLDLDLYAVVDI